MLKQDTPQTLHDIIETTFTGQKLNLSLDQISHLIEDVKRSENVLNRTRLLQYGLMTTLIEEAECAKGSGIPMTFLQLFSSLHQDIRKVIGIPDPFN